LSLTLLGQAPPAEADNYEYGGAGLSTQEREGRNTWYFWTGGGEKFWRQTAQITHGITDLLQYVDSRRRPERFKTLGVLNDPDCTQATAPDEFGLWMDVCKTVDVPGIPSQSSGIVGLRKFKNPKFDKFTWDVKKYLADPATVEPPYLIGMTCGFCHIGFNPLYPPKDPENPRWYNFSSAIGNQYFKEGTLFGLKLTPKDFRWHIADKQPAGTSDTSRFATDHIFNPNAINSIVYLADRPWQTETMADGTTRPVHHILKDGADSIGTAGASLRVYVNIGMCSDYWTTLHDPISGTKMTQKPFRIDLARKDCADWRATESRMEGAEAFLKTVMPARLPAEHLTKDAAQLARGAQAFAENCARCHSSKQPPEGTADATAWYREAVKRPDFLDRNFLSNDRRVSVAEVGTNIGRAMATNATAGHVWDEFSSRTYKEQAPAAELKGLYNPVRPSKPITFKPPGGGRGYYRVPTLAGVWATAPFLHNNALGLFNGDPTVQGRLVAFNDAMEKMLWPERRPGENGIWRTSEASAVPLESGYQLKVPKGTPVHLFGNINAPQMQLLRNDNFFTRFIGFFVGRGLLNNVLLRNNLSPDFVVDRGHTFGSGLSDADKRALIEYVRTF
jgi:mono/diheme cytochrome c family protein